MSEYEIGQQPCDNFTPQMESNAYATWTNEHQCYRCGGDVTVSFCENCMRDHHSGGYETCTREDKAK